MSVNGNVKIFTGNAHPALTEEICRHLSCDLGQANTTRFSDGEFNFHIQENVRGADVFIIQPTCPPTDRNLMELLIMIDTFVRASAERVTAVIPYFGYGRTDKKDQPRVPITARLVAKLVGVSGADRALLLDLHAGQIQGFFDVPVDEMSAMSLTASYFAQKRLSDPVVVSPDLGNTKRARNFAEIVDAPLAIIEKRRAGNRDRTEVLNLIGSVEGRQAIIVDDEIDTAGSITQAADVCLEAGATEVYASAIHAVLSGPAVQRLQECVIREVVITNSIAVPLEKRFSKLTVLSVASLLGETVQRIHTGASVSATYRTQEAMAAI